MGVWVENKSNAHALCDVKILSLKGTRFSIRTPGSYGVEVRRGNFLVGSYASIDSAKLAILLELAESVRNTGNSGFRESIWTRNSLPSKQSLCKMVEDFSALLEKRFGAKECSATEHTRFRCRCVYWEAVSAISDLSRGLEQPLQKQGIEHDNDSR